MKNYRLCINYEKYKNKQEINRLDYDNKIRLRTRRKIITL